MKNSKKFLSAIMSATILASSIAAIPASADYTVKENKTTLISENFDNLTINEDKQYTTAGTKLGNYAWYRNNQWGSNVGQKFSVADGKFIMSSKSTTTASGAADASIICFTPSSAATIDRGDFLHINFDASMNGDNTLDSYVSVQFGDQKAKGRETVNGAGSSLPNYKYTTINGTAVNKDNKSAQPFTYTTNAVATLANKGMYFGNTIAGGDNSNIGNNVNVDIVINPYDEEQDNKQTIKTTFTYTTSSNDTQTVTNYSVFDADYTGTDDISVDKITEFNYLRFYVPFGDKFELTLDNMLVEKLNYSKEYYTSAVQNVINYDFSNAVDYVSTDKWNVCAPVDESGNVYFSTMYQGTGSGKVEKIAGPNGSDVYAFKQSIGSAVNGNAFNILTLRNPNGNTVINDGDVIRFSYDLKHDSKTNLTPSGSYAPIYFFGPMLNSPRYDNDNIWFSTNYDITQNSNVWMGSDTTAAKITAHTNYRNGFLLETENTNSGATTRLFARTSTSENVLQDQWHHYEYIINTADKTKDGKQTIKVYIDKGTSNEIVLYSTLDTNITDSAESKYTEFNTLEMFFTRINCKSEAGTIYSTNYKLDIITPSFGISGEAISNNDPTGGIKLDAGKMTVECALNVPGTDKKKTDSDYPTYNYTLYAAQYDGNTLVDVKLVKATFTEDNCKATFDVDVKNGANKLKLFAFDENLTPLVVNETATVNGSAASHSISYSLNTADMH